MEIKSSLNILWNAFRKRINKSFIHDKKYQIGEYKLSVPSSLNLLDNQKKYILYDRFLPVLAKHFPSKGLIIDVGANVGDTLSAMIRECSNSFVCIEGSPFFFKYLKKNVDVFSSYDYQRIKLIQELVGTGEIAGSLNANEGSTASIKITKDQTISTHIPLDQIIEEHNNVLFLKSDVDGFDFDVIKSGEKILKESQPILFWENQIENKFQYEGFNDLYNLLKENDYTDIYIFDNYGNILIENSDYHILENIHNYLYNMTKSQIPTTFCYVDVLAVTKSNVQIVRNAIDEYKDKYLEIREKDERTDYSR